MSKVLCSRHRIVHCLPLYEKLYTFRQLEKNIHRRFYRRTANYTLNEYYVVKVGAFVVGTGAIYWLNTNGKTRRKQSSFPHSSFVLSAASNDVEFSSPETDLTLKQMKFEEYASYEYGEKRLMSPNDFLCSLIDNKEGF